MNGMLKWLIIIVLAEAVFLGVAVATNANRRERLRQFLSGDGAKDSEACGTWHMAGADSLPRGHLAQWRGRKCPRPLLELCLGQEAG